MMSSWGMATVRGRARTRSDRGPLINIGADRSHVQQFGIVERTGGHIVEDVQLLGRAHQNGLDYSLQNRWPVDLHGPSRNVTAHEIVHDDRIGSRRRKSAGL